MKKNKLTLVVVAFLMLSVNLVSAQTAKALFDVITTSGEVVRNAKIAKATDTDYMVATVTHLPDLTKYDVVVATLSYKGIDKVVGYYQLTGKEMWSITKTSSKVAGMKYLQLTVVDKKTENKGGEFTIDAFPFDVFDFPYIFSKEGNKNLDSYTMQLELDGRMITGYEDKWENDVHKRIPIYGDFLPIAKAYQIKIVTSANVAKKPLSKEVNSTNSLLDAINAGNKKVKELR